MGVPGVEIMNLEITAVRLEEYDVGNGRWEIRFASGYPSGKVLSRADNQTDAWKAASLILADRMALVLGCIGDDAINGL